MGVGGTAYLPLCDVCTYVHTYIVCSLVEQGRVCELCQEMGQQREELLRETELLKSKLKGKLHVCLCVNVLMGI